MIEKTYFTRWRDPRKGHDNRWHEDEHLTLKGACKAYHQDRDYFYNYIEVEMGTVEREARVKAKGRNIP